MKLVFVLLISLQLFFLGCSEGTNKKIVKDYYEKINLLVLSEGRIGEEYYFKEPSSKGILEYKVKYLGCIKTSQGHNLKFLNNIVLSGLNEDSKRASCSVDIYDNSDNKIGYYYVGGAIDAPEKIEGGKLVFNYNNDRCNQFTAISFVDSIPNQIFVSCSKEGGDIYTFSKE